jgi:hypothetical protein
MVFFFLILMVGVALLIDYLKTKNEKSIPKEKETLNQSNRFLKLDPDLTPNLQ